MEFIGLSQEILLAVATEVARQWFTPTAITITMLICGFALGSAHQSLFFGAVLAMLTSLYLGYALYDAVIANMPHIIYYAGWAQVILITLFGIILWRSGPDDTVMFIFAAGISFFGARSLLLAPWLLPQLTMGDDNPTIVMLALGGLVAVIAVLALAIYTMIGVALNRAALFMASPVLIRRSAAAVLICFGLVGLFGIAR